MLVWSADSWGSRLQVRNKYINILLLAWCKILWGDEHSHINSIVDGLYLKAYNVHAHMLAAIPAHLSSSLIGIVDFSCTLYVFWLLCLLLYDWLTTCLYKWVYTCWLSLDSIWLWWYSFTHALYLPSYIQLGITDQFSVTCSSAIFLFSTNNKGMSVWACAACKRWQLSLYRQWQSLPKCANIWSDRHNVRWI